MAQNKIDFTRNALPLDDSWDVIVVGGGPAGCAAAYASAREGAKTLLIESQGCLGGMGTAGLVPAWCPFSDGEKIIYGGFAKKVFLESKKGVPFEPEGKLDWVAINPEQLKRVYDSFMEEAGVHLRLFTFFCDIIMESEGKIGSVITAAKDGLKAWSAKVYIDCTGDGDIAASAGAEYELGREGDHDLQPGTMCFQLAGVDTEKYLSGPLLHAHLNHRSPIFDALKSGRYPLIPDEHICQNSVGNSVVGFNAGHIWEINNCDPKSMSPAMIKGRKMAEEYRRFLADMLPDAFSKSFVSATGNLMGIRETRRIKGEYSLSSEDYMSRRSFEDEIGRNCYYIDIHASARENVKTGDNEKKIRFERYRIGESHGIPYRCLIPRNTSNLLVAGRCISTDRAVNGSVRVMPVCLVTGEAAGTAAALSCKNSVRPKNLDIPLLRKTLLKNGAYLP